MVKFNQFFGQKILVTGASGFIGPHLCRKLSKYGADVFATSRTGGPADNNHIRWSRGDFSDLPTVRTVLNDIKPDVIFHLAGHAAGGRELELVLPTYHSNLTTTVNLLSVATETGCGRIILPASMEEPDASKLEMIPSSPYAAGKWASSAYARMFHKLYNTPVVILRVFMTYGPGKQNPHKLLPYVITSLLKGQAPKLGSGERQIDWIYVDDVIGGMLFAALASDVEGATIDLGSGATLSIQMIVKHLVNLVDSNVKPLFGDIPDRPMEQVRMANTADTYGKLGWKPQTSLEIGLRKTVDWYRKQLNIGKNAHSRYHD